MNDHYIRRIIEQGISTEELIERVRKEKREDMKTDKGQHNRNYPDDATNLNMFGFFRGLKRR